MSDRKEILLREAYDILKKLDDSSLVKNALEKTDFYDGCDCDVSCLLCDIAIELDIQECEHCGYIDCICCDADICSDMGARG